MKRSSLLLLAAVVCAAACTDATAPANSHALLTPKNPELEIVGNPPPPPVDVAMTICVDGVGCSAYDGTYFSNGSTLESAVAAALVNDESLTFDGTAWLMLDNTQPTTDGTSSPNTRFKQQKDKRSSSGYLVIKLETVIITRVTGFDPSPTCGIAGELCAFITFDATVNGVPTAGTVRAFDKSICTLSTSSEGDSYYSCGDIIL
jgi:hypothetical protein